jgi:hypothetical protein
VFVSDKVIFPLVLSVSNTTVNAMNVEDEYVFRICADAVKLVKSNDDPAESFIVIVVE